MATIITDNSPQAQAAMEHGIKMALEAVGQNVQGYATALCPTDTGRLKGSITYATDSKSSSVRSPASSEDGLSAGAEKNTVYIGSNVFYSAYVENGTSRRDPKPFLQPAAANHTAELEKQIAAMIQLAFQQAGF